MYSVQYMYIITHKNRHHSRVGYGMVLNPRHVMVTLSVISRGYGAFLLVELLCKGAVNRDFQPPVLSSIEAIPSLAKISPSYSNFSKSPIEIGYSTLSPQCVNLPGEYNPGESRMTLQGVPLIKKNLEDESLVEVSL